MSTIDTQQLPWLGALVLLGGLLFSSAASAFGVGVAPANLEFDLEPGSITRKVLRVKNFNTEKPIRLSVSSTDWTLNSDGEVELLPPSTIKKSATPWIRFSPSILMLPPNGNGTVTVDIAAPVAGLSSGDYRSAVVVSTLLPPKAERERQGGVWNRYQIASLFYANVNNGRSEPLIISSEFDQVNTKNLRRLIIGVQNTGSAHARVKGEISLLDASNDIVLSKPFESVVLEEQERLISVDFDQSRLAPGEYTAEIKLEDNGKSIEPLSRRPKFTVK